MTLRLFTVAVLTSLSLTTAGFAQSAEAETSESGSGAPALTDTLSLGEEVETPPEERQFGDVYLKEENKDWQVQCIHVPEGQTEPCQIFQLLRGQDGNPVAEFTMFRLKPGGPAIAGANVIVPLETALEAQLTIAVDGAPAKRYPYSFCTKVGCFARIGLTQEDIAIYKRGAVATITIVPFVAQNQPETLTLSLKGFTASFDQASVVVQ